jgi:hypothetical protein
MIDTKNRSYKVGISEKEKHKFKKLKNIFSL